MHTLDLPAGNRTSDAEIIAVADRDDRIVVTKDADFVSSFITSRRPEKLLLISTGNFTNAKSEALLLPNLVAVAAAFDSHDFVELTRTTLIVHM